jgi:hypothetical protein
VRACDVCPRSAAEYTKRFVYSWSRITNYQRAEHSVLMRVFDGERRTRTADTTIFSRVALILSPASLQGFSLISACLVSSVFSRTLRPFAG